MGEAKNRGNKDQRATEAKLFKLGDTPMETAYEMLFGMLKMVYSETGGINHELIGYEFEAGVPVGVNVLLITSENVNRVPQMIEQMLQKWSVVAHVVEAFATPVGDDGFHDASNRREIIGVVMHTESGASQASCDVNPEMRTVTKGVLQKIESLQGSFSREFPQKH